MKRIRLNKAAGLAVSLALHGCHSRPDVAVIAASATSKIQKQLDTDFGRGKARVGAVEMVETSSPHYEGTASVAVGAQTIALPIKITSDGATTLVEDDDTRVGDAIKADDLASIATLNGKYSDYMLSPALFSKLPAAAGADRAKFVERLQTVVPIVHEDGGYFGSGCKAHQCDRDGAAWFISDDGSKAVAITLETDVPTTAGQAAGFTSSPNFQIYGSSVADLPAPLASWASDQGMTAMNIGGNADLYVPPAKN